jgi:hypothetical protein
MPVIDSIKVAQTGPEVPSPWWLKGGAIFIGVLGLLSLFNAVSLALAGIAMDTMMEEMDSEEICAEDEDTEECEDFIDSIAQFSSMPLWDIGAAFSALLFILSVPTTILLWNAEDRDMALKLAWGWVFVHAFSQLYITHEFMEWYGTFFDSIPIEDFQWVPLFTSFLSYGGVLICESTLAAGLVLISYKTRPPTELEMPSAFHVSEE